MQQLLSWPYQQSSANIFDLKKHEENPEKCIWLYGNSMAKNPNILYSYIIIIMLIRQLLSSKILLGFLEALY